MRMLAFTAHLLLVGLVVLQAAAQDAASPRNQNTGAEAAITALHHARGGDLWLGTRQGLLRFDGAMFNAIPPPAGAAWDPITTLHENDNGILWIGTKQAGIAVYTRGAAGAFSIADGLSSNRVTAIAEDSQGGVWIGTADAGITILRGEHLVHLQHSDGLPQEPIGALHTSVDGGMWIGAGAAVVRVSTFGEVLEPSLHDFPRQVTAFANDSSGALLVGTRGGGLWRYGTDGRSRYLGDQNGAIGDTVYALETSSAGHVWAATDRGLAHSSSGGDDFRAVSLAERSSGNVVSALAAHASDGVWAASAGGELNRIRAVPVTPETSTYIVERIAAASRNRIGIVPGGNAESANVQNDRIQFYEMPLFQLLCFIALAILILVAYRWRVQHLKAREEELLELIHLHTRHLREEKEKTEHALAETDRARHEAERQKVIAQNARAVIEEQAEKLRELDRIKTRFFSNVSHEFRTPLTLTIGPLENMLAGVYGPLQEHAYKQLDLALRNARRLLRLINQLLDLTKLESGKMDLAVSRSNVVPLAEGVVLSFSAFAEKKDLTLSFDSEAPEIYLYFDPACLEKVLFNLVSNAVKFTGPGGRISVSVEEGTTEIKGNHYEVVFIRVEDSGLGIPDEQLPYIFDRFHQVDGAMAHAYEGTGIGLSLVKELVELHHGSITVCSEHGSGSEFIVALPKGVDHFGNDVLLGDWPGAAASDVSRGPMMELAVLNDADELREDVLSVDRSLHGDGGSWPSHLPHVAPVARTHSSHTRRPAESTEQPSNPSLPAAPLAEPVGRQSILVVDDNPDVVEYVTIALSREYDVMSASNGHDGLSMARDEMPSLIISDVMMPGMDGYELCRRVKSDEFLRHIPVILLTAKAALNDKVEGLEAGSDDYIPKPFSTRELRARIRNLLTVREQQHMLSHLNSELSQKNDALREASEMKSQLLAIAAHDMKNPLNAIREFARILKDEVGEESDHYDPLDLIHKSSDQMLHLVSTLLDSAALETGQITLELEPLDVNTLAAAVVRRNQKLAERKRQTLELSPASQRAFVNADRSRILEALDNLVNNAVKYSPPERPIRVSVQLSEASVRFSVEDEGPGFSEEDRSKLFRKFQRLSAQPTGGETSTGLGLAIVKQIVEMHEGRIALQSAPG